LWCRRRETRRQVEWEDGFAWGGGYIVEMSAGAGEWELLYNLHTIYTLGLLRLGELYIVVGIHTQTQINSHIRVSDRAIHNAFLQGVIISTTCLHINSMGTTTFNTPDSTNQ
jgi:hypothetical protein